MYFSDQHFNMYFSELGDGRAPAVVSCREEDNFIKAILMAFFVGDNQYFYVAGSIIPILRFRPTRPLGYYSYSPIQSTGNVIKSS